MGCRGYAVSGPAISGMTIKSSLLTSGAYVPVVLNGDLTNYRFDLGAAIAARPTLVTPQLYGAVADGVTDDSAAFVAAIAALKLAGAALTNGVQNQASAKLFVPAGNYYMGTTTLDITHTLIIEGEGSGHAGAALASKLTWAAGATGIRIQRYNTSGSGTVDGVTHTGGDGTIIRGLALYGGYTATEGEFHGIHAKARFTVEHCHIQNFEGDAIYSHATAGGGAPNEGNANTAHVANTSTWYCRNGLNIDGADTNIWTVIACDFSYSRQWGIWDSSFLGNSYFGVHAEFNGTTGGTPCWVSYSSNVYVVKKGQEAGASTNAPSGTTADNTWWYYFGAGAASVPFNRPAWVSGTTYRAGGSYCTDDTGNAGVLISGCYHEGGQPFAQFVTPTLVEGGSMYPNLKGVTCLVGGADVRSRSGGFVADGNFTGFGTQHQLGPQSGTAADVLLQLYNTNVNSQIQGISTSGSVGFLSFHYGFGIEINPANAGWTIRLQNNGTDIAKVGSGGIDLQTGKILTVNAVQVVTARQTGWAADTGTAKKTANATYAAGTTLTYSATYVQVEQTAMATRMAAVEAALQNIAQTQKAIKDALITHGLIGT